MPEAFSIGFLASYTAINLFVRSNNGVSAEADALRSSAFELIRSSERSVALFGRQNDAIADIHLLAQECSSDSTRLDPVAIELAEEFLRVLPEEIPIPEFAAEPRGSISLDWIQSRNRMFSLSIGSSRRLAFAWLDGTDRGHGVVAFDGRCIPRKVLEGINAIIDGNTGFGSA